MAFPIIPKKRSGSAGHPSTLAVGELAVNTLNGELYLGGDQAVMLLNGPVAAGTTVTEHTGNGSTTAFAFAGFNGTDDAGYIVSVGGIDQPPSKYSISNTNGGTITFVEAPVAGELISIRALVAGSGGGGSGNATSIQGRPVLDSPPDERMSLTWFNNQWMPSFTSELGGTALAHPFEPTENDVLKWNGSAWAPASNYGSDAIQAWDPERLYIIGDVVHFQQDPYGLFIYRCVGPNLNEPPYSNWTYWRMLNANAFAIGNDTNGNPCSVRQGASPVDNQTLVWSDTTGVWEFETMPEVPTIETTSSPSSDGGLSSAGITVAGWLNVKGYKVPYFV
jgi:hypothetical protein